MTLTSLATKQSLDAGSQPRFLATMAGSEVFDKTYCRVYQGSVDTDKLREHFFKCIKGMRFGPYHDKVKQFGERYHLCLYNCKGKKPTDPKERGFFLTLEKLGKRQKVLSSSLSYALRALKPQLEALSGLKIQEIQEQCIAYGTVYLLHCFFNPVHVPKDGDLVVYPQIEHTKSQYGLFIKNVSIPGFLGGGTVKSKWSWFSHQYVFQHDVFFIPTSCGNVAQFYRIKKINNRCLDTLIIQPHQWDHSEPVLRSNKSFTIQMDGILRFKYTEKNIARRKIIDDNDFGQLLSYKIPEIECLPYIAFSGRCHEYAFERILPTCGETLYAESFSSTILAQYFSVTGKPKKGDLVVYFNIGIVHWGIYLGNGRVESKWGAAYVYRHPFFDVPSSYGDTIRCYRLNEGLNAEKLKRALAHHN